MFTFTLLNNNYEVWDKINNLADHSSFLTSSEWIEFQKSQGKEIYQYLITKDRRYEGLVYIEVYRRRFQKFAYAPYNPILSPEMIGSGKELVTFWSSFKTFSENFIKEQNLTLFRFDPLLSINYLQNLLNSGFKQALAPGQAKDTWEINLEQTEEDLRSRMSKSTRYNINKTSREGFEFIHASNDEHIKAFSELMLETTGRKGFGNYDYTYFKKQFEKLNDKKRMDIFLVKKDDKYLAGALINYNGETAYYTHGCSTSNRNLARLRAPYFLQWNLILKLKVEKFKLYNMWGILPEGIKGSISGVSEYKRSFGGHEVNYIGPIEVYNDKLKYTLHRLIDWWVYRKDRY